MSLSLTPDSLCICVSSDSFSTHNSPATHTPGRSEWRPRHLASHAPGPSERGVKPSGYVTKPPQTDSSAGGRHHHLGWCSSSLHTSLSSVLGQDCGVVGSRSNSSSSISSHCPTHTHTQPSSVPTGAAAISSREALKGGLAIGLRDETSSLLGRSLSGSQ